MFVLYSRTSSSLCGTSSTLCGTSSTLCRTSSTLCGEGDSNVNSYVGASGPGGKLRRNIQGAYEVLRKRCRAPHSIWTTLDKGYSLYPVWYLLYPATFTHLFVRS